MAANSVIPDVTFITPSSAAPAATMNASATPAQKSQQTIAGLGAVIPVTYGTDRIGAKVAVVGSTTAGKLILLCVWGEGPIDSVTELQINDLPLTAGVTGVNHLGTLSQTADTTLVAYFASKGKTYMDTLPGIAYSVLSIAPSANVGFPRVTAKIKGRLVATSSGGTPVWSENPAYCIADFITNNTYGMGGQVNWTDVAALAATCDALVSGEKKRILGLTIDQAQSPETWLTTLRDYASCFIYQSQGIYRLVPDVSSASVMSFTDSNILQGSLNLQKRGLANTPTVVQTVYRDTSVVPWIDSDPVEAAVPGAVRRVSRISRPGTQRYSEAMRYSIERLNDFTLNDLSGSFVAFDEALSLSPWDLITITHSVGFLNKLFRVVSIEPKEVGRWTVNIIEYDPAKYSSSVVTGPTTVDTSLPNPSAPPAVSNLAVSEDVYSVQTGLFNSRLRISWDELTTFPFVKDFSVTIKIGDTLIETTTVPSSSVGYVSMPIEEGPTYVISVITNSTSFAASTAATASITPIGKQAKPTDVPLIEGYEDSGEVRLTWRPATDLDLTATELRFGATAGTWATAQVLDRVAAPALRYSTRVIPAGTWRIYAKGLDSVRTDDYPWGQESVNATYFDIDVSINPNTYLLDIVNFVSPTLTNMVSVGGDGGGGWTSDNGSTWGTLFPSAMSTYTSVLGSYFGGVTSTLVTEAADFGQTYSGLLVASIDYVDLNGTAVIYLETSTDNINWTQWTGLSTQASLRYARIRITTSGAMLVTDAGSVYMRVNTKSEDGAWTSSAGGPVTVTLGDRYSALKTLQLTADGTAGQRNPVYLNVSLAQPGRYVDVDVIPEDFVDEAYLPNSSFDVACYDGANALVVATGRWLFTGI